MYREPDIVFGDWGVEDDGNVKVNDVLADGKGGKYLGDYQFSGVMSSVILGEGNNQKMENGEEIVEGHIVELLWSEVGCEVPEEFFGVVVFMEGGFCVENDKWVKPLPNECHGNKGWGVPLWQELAAWSIVGHVCTHRDKAGECIGLDRASGASLIALAGDELLGNKKKDYESA